MKIISSKEEITFDDVLLLPGKSDFDIEEERAKTNLKSRLTKNLSIDIPIVSSPMPGVTEAEMAIAIAKLGGLGFIHHFQDFDAQLRQLQEVKAQYLKVAGCVADLSQRGLNHIENMLNLKVDLISIETAHALNVKTIDFIKRVKKRFKKVEISVSLVVTREATEELIKAGADNIRVGIGGGSHCTTRLVTGVGRSQLSAVKECFSTAKKYGIPILSDTGVRYAGDIVKALAFGAETVMIGGMFSGTKETPGPLIKKNNKHYKYSWGMCTDLAMRQKKPFYFYSLSDIKHRIKQILTLDFNYNIAEQKLFEEGVEALIPYKGSVNPIIDELISATRRSMWYIGVRNLSQLRDKARVVLVSQHTKIENLPRI